MLCSIVVAEASVRVYIVDVRRCRLCTALYCVLILASVSDDVQLAWGLACLSWRAMTRVVSCGLDWLVTSLSFLRKMSYRGAASK